MADNLTRTITIKVDGRELKEVPRKIGIIGKEYRKLRKSTDLLVEGSDAYNANIKELSRLRGILNKHNKRINGVEKGWRSLVALAKKFAPALAGAFAIGGVAQLGKELLNTGIQMDALAKKANKVLGPALGYVTAEAEKNAEAMGLTTAEYINAVAAAQDLLIPMGFQRDEAAQISTQLVNLSGALSEWTGGQRSAQEVSEILNKALLGEREQLKGLGISIQEADVKQRLYQKGLKDLAGDTLKQAKAAATLELILEKSADAQAAFAENSGSLVRTQAELTAKFNEAKETISVALIPVFNRLLDVALDIADGIELVTQAVERFLDPAKAARQEYEAQALSVAALESELEPLLATYEDLTGKSKLTKEEQDELANVIQRIGEITPNAIVQLDEQGRVLGINAEKSREFLEAEKDRLKFVNQTAITSTEKQIKKLEQQSEALQNLFNVDGAKLSEGARQFERINGVINEIRLGSIKEGIKGGASPLDPDTITRLNDRLKKTASLLTGARAQLDVLTGANIDTSSSEVDTGGSGDGKTEAEIEAEKERLRKLAEERAKAREKELERQQKAEERKQAQLERSLQKIKDFTKQTQQELATLQLQESEQELERIRQKYAKQLEEVKRLEANQVEGAAEARAELEQLRDAELEQKRTEQLQKEAERIQELTDQRIDMETEATLEAFEAEQLLKQELFEATATQLDLELAQMRAHYGALLFEAEKYGIDTTALEQKREEEEKKIRDKFRKQEEETTIAHQKRIIAQRAALITSIGQSLTALADLVGEESREAAVFSKVLTGAQIAIDTARAISGAVAAGASLPFPANLAAIATGIATVLSNIAQAKKLLTQEIPQKAEGGYTEEGKHFRVKGQDDKREYNAKFLGRPDSGLLPGGPSLILANERGQEYFVAAHHLQDPLIADYVQIIDNLVNTKQMASGGFTTPGPSRASSGADQSGIDEGMANQLAEVLVQLTGVLSRLQSEGINLSYEDAERISDMITDIEEIKG